MGYNDGMGTNKSLRILLAVVLLNYAAQIPYYLHRYYFSRHLPPSIPGSLLLTVTLVWFLAGYIRYRQGRSYGHGLLVSFLVTQVLFYGHSVLFGLFTSGGIVAQVRTNSPFLLIIFLIGYLNFVVAAYYVWWLVKRGRSHLRTKTKITR